MPSKLHLLWSLMPLWICTGLIGWGLWRWLKASDEPLALIVRWLVSAVVLGFVFITAVRARDEMSKIVALLVGCVGGVIMAIVWREKFCDFVGDLFASLYTGGKQQVDPTPFYSIAEGKRKQGKYLEAIERVREQLTRFPTDFTGWMLLAEIQAENLNDLPTAHETIAELLRQEGHAPKNIAYALNREADWNLKLARDPIAARTALERIIEILPDTEQAQLALQRISHLASQEMLDAKAQPVRVPVQRRSENIGLRTEPIEKPAAEDPAVTAGELVSRLEQFPYDNEAREKLALIYARFYGRLDLATEQLDQLIAAPSQPPKLVVHWLNLLADLQLEMTGETSAARPVLQRIVELYPKSAAAENALNRIAHLKLELRPKQQSQAIKLGSYEQNIGLRAARKERSAEEEQEATNG